MILPRIGLERKYRWKQTYIVQILILFLSFLASALSLGLLISTSISTMTIKSVFGWFGTCSIRENWFDGHRMWSSLQNDPFQNWHFFCTRLTLTTDRFLWMFLGGIWWYDDFVFGSFLNNLESSSWIFKPQVFGSKSRIFIQTKNVLKNLREDLTSGRLPAGSSFSS